MLNSFREMLVKHYSLCAALYAIITEWEKTALAGYQTQGSERTIHSSHTQPRVFPRTEKATVFPKQTFLSNYSLETIQYLFF